jgi:hypothetical protein
MPLRVYLLCTTSSVPILVQISLYKHRGHINTWFFHMVLKAQDCAVPCVGLLCAMYVFQLFFDTWITKISDGAVVPGIQYVCPEKTVLIVFNPIR